VSTGPNVLFITLDQFRGDHLAHLGHPHVQTPHLDALARRGVSFARHYSQAAPCGPGRACLYTGTYQSTNRVVFNGTPLDDRFDNVARVARRAGYIPTLFGYTDQAVDPRTVDDPDDPRLGTYEGVLPGFEVALDLTHQREAWNRWVADHGYPTHADPDQMLATEPDRPAEVGISAFLTDRFETWLDQQRGPWFAHLSHLRPHPPYAAAGVWAAAFDPAGMNDPIAPAEGRHPLHDTMLSMTGLAAPDDEHAMRAIRAQYLGMIADVDEQVGRALAAIERRGELGDTVVIVTSDHGDQLGDHGLLGKLGWFEASYAIPCIIADPRRPAAHGTVVDAFTENVDVLPTLCTLIGVPTPAQCDGASLEAFLDGEPTPPTWRDAAVWEFDWRALMLMGGVDPVSAGAELAAMNLCVWRSADTAYIQFGDGSWQCFDLAADPTWRTPTEDHSRVFDAARAMLTWRSRHLDRTLSDTLLEGTLLGRIPDRPSWTPGA